eukprot:gnl/Hemi2/7034_TR2410_c0_g1_i1.p1 gnl/Hemi2/7034_TR2410_c0_g1~~gnl/Hemi2/7034_TR2410_c0_g1_i1.p1  ORF type:complete len:474 (+),score=45.19 gnl/Hemi2/7034_TR2410_c0_g1_i1:92-1513(+)
MADARSVAGSTSSMKRTGSYSNPLRRASFAQVPDSVSVSGYSQRSGQGHAGGLKTTNYKRPPSDGGSVRTSNQGQSVAGKSVRSGTSGEVISGVVSSSAWSDDINVEETKVLADRDLLKLDTKNYSPLRMFLLDLVEDKRFGAVVLAAIFLNVIFIGVESFSAVQRDIGWSLSACDQLFQSVYVAEIVLKFTVYGVKFFDIGWNNFDLFVVCSGFVDYVQFLIASFLKINASVFRVLRVLRTIRALRALRALRSVKMLKSLSMIVSGLIGSLPAIASIAAFAGIIAYIWGIIGRQLYKGYLSVETAEEFIDIPHSMFTMFALITFDNWSVLAIPMYKAAGVSVVIFFVFYLVLENFIMVNMFVAVLVNQMQIRFKAEESAELEKARRAQERLVRKMKDDDFVLEQDLSNTDLSINDIDTHYPSPNIPHRRKMLLGHYFQLLAAIESNFDIYHQQRKRMDDWIDHTVVNFKEKK